MSEPNSRKSRRPVIIAVAILVVLAVIFAVAFFLLRGRPTQGDKAVSLEVVYEDGSAENYEIKTDAEYLKEAVESVVTIEGEDGAYGFTLYTVNGVTADWNEGVYWAVYVNGEYGSYSLDQQPVTDGDSYQLVYETL